MKQSVFEVPTCQLQAQLQIWCTQCWIDPFLLLSLGYNTSLKNTRGEINICNLVHVLDMKVAILFIHWAQKSFCAHKQLTQVSCWTNFFRKLPIAHLFIHSSLFTDLFLIVSFTPSFLPFFLPSFLPSFLHSFIEFFFYLLGQLFIDHEMEQFFHTVENPKLSQKKTGLFMFCFISCQNVPIVHCETLDAWVFPVQVLTWTCPLPLLSFAHEGLKCLKVKTYITPQFGRCLIFTFSFIRGTGVASWILQYSLTSTSSRIWLVSSTQRWMISTQSGLNSWYLDIKISQVFSILRSVCCSTGQGASHQTTAFLSWHWKYIQLEEGKVVPLIIGF